jgi:anti-anti-sigma factor
MFLMDVVITHEQGDVPVSVFHIDGDVDSSTYEELERVSLEEIDTGARFILYDLSQVPFMSSAGFRSLLKVVKQLNTLSEKDNAVTSNGHASGKKSPYLKLLKPNKLVFSTMELAGLDAMLEIYEEVPDAVASFRQV